MNKRQMGLYQKFRVERTDGRSARGEKHERCDYFVLDLVHDVFARPALEAYAAACASEYPNLAADLRLRLAGEFPTYADDLNNLRQPFAPRPPVGLSGTSGEPAPAFSMRDALLGKLGPSELLDVLAAHRRFHGKVGCPEGDDCYVCQAEDALNRVARTGTEGNE